ncbi:hypothetical protein FO519_009541 [Halicephalobus sp. NKZ332]|nr:hypothetical protein FO519_009541 [Halicephalobus sp. NKZ332]
MDKVEKSIIFIFWVELFFGVRVLGVIPCTEENGLYECESGRCIPTQWLCDSGKDCPDGDDEYHTNCGSQEDRGECDPFHFHCVDPHSNQSRCARPEWRCDGFIDCQGGIDEENCEINPTELQPLFGQPTPPSSRPNGSDTEDQNPLNSFKVNQISPTSGFENIKKNATVIRNATIPKFNKEELVKNFTLIVSQAEERSRNRNKGNVAKPPQVLISGGQAPTTKNMNPIVTTTTKPLITFSNNSTVFNANRMNPPVPIEEKIVSPNLTLLSIDPRLRTNSTLPPIGPGLDTNFTVKPFIRPENEIKNDEPVLITVKGNAPTTVKPFIRPENQIAPLEAAVGTPIVPRGDFQVLIPMDVIRDQELEHVGIKRKEDTEITQNTVYPDFKFANDDDKILRARRPPTIP